MPKELWVEISNFPDYLVSNRGKVYSKKRNKLLTPRVNSRGYLAVALYTHGEKTRKQFTIHKLVLEGFLGKGPVGLQCNHKDGGKKHNFLNNLEYVTPKQNVDHAAKLGRRNQLRRRNKKTGRFLLTPNR